MSTEIVINFLKNKDYKGLSEFMKDPKNANLKVVKELKKMLEIFINTENAGNED